MKGNDDYDGPIPVTVPDEGELTITEIIVRTEDGGEWRYVGREKKTRRITPTDFVHFKAVEYIP